MLSAMRFSDSSFRLASLPDGSPILVVPPPMRTMGRWPVRCMCRSSMIGTRLPACRESAVASNPM